ncbi:MAG: pyruvate:ferredoxin (flavodoxin) oxidoreductase [Archangium sp.]|nr:pyruvate:ferredoxin (flavodoxin) oxidoreductase [Archangium sp.]
MSHSETLMVDGNEAVAHVAHRLTETIAIYPITPSSTMAELADEWSAQGRTNIWGGVPQVVQLQSEAGAAGTVHGALMAGSLTTTFTASQGLLLMIPNLYKLAGELTPFAMHVAARTLATHALSIFGDHSDVMACRQIGTALLASGSVQEAHDLAAVAHAATMTSRIPFMHFFDGFRTSHEVARIEVLSDDVLRALMDPKAEAAHRGRALNPDRPVLRGTAQNPDTFFQAREACSPFYEACPDQVQAVMAKLGELTGRHYKLFDYVGHPEAERVVVVMGSGAEVTHELVEALAAKGEKVGVLKVRLFRPWKAEAFVAALPKSVKAIAVLDRTKEPGSIGEPLYMDVLSTFAELGHGPKIIGGRYGLSSKEFNGGMVKAVLDELSKPSPKNHFTIGIVDDVSHSSLNWDPTYEVAHPQRVQAVFYGLGADGTVGANKNTIKIIGEETKHSAQGYFVYDSKKSGAMTISHLRFGPGPIRSSYLVRQANFVGVHQFQFVDKLDVLELAAPGAVVLLNAPYAQEAVWDRLPREMQLQILEKKLQVYVIDASAVAREAGMAGRINSVMQTCFFAISGVLPRDEAISYIKKSIEKTYKKKGAEVIGRNFAAVDATLAHLHRLSIPIKVTSSHNRTPVVSKAAPDFVQRVTAVMLANQGDLLPVSAFPPDGVWPTGTSKWEKRDIAEEIPVWDEKICIQCNKCALVCPHAAIRAKAYPADLLSAKPIDFKSMPYKGPELPGMAYTIQVATEDCTGCRLCVEICPAKDKANPKHKSLEMSPRVEDKGPERADLDFFLGLPEVDRTKVRLEVKGTQLLQPLFEYSGACAGCGETPYLKLLTQLYGDRLLIANATGCTSIYGGNLPTTPYSQNRDGRGPAWANSLFEDNAEFGYGMRMGVDALRDRALRLLRKLGPTVGDALTTALLNADQSSEALLAEQRARVVALRTALKGRPDPDSQVLSELADYLVRKSVWIVGGDGWAYDIGFGGVDHVIAQGRDVNLLVLDTEVYSNTGGQASKATPIGASAKFAAAGKTGGKKDLGMIAMAYGNVYVARIASGAKDAQTVKAFQEAESYPGTSLIIAYSHCIAHGYDMAKGPEQQKHAVESGIWPLYRYDPRRIEKGEPALQLDSGPPKFPVGDYMREEARFRITENLDPERYQRLVKQAQLGAQQHYAVLEQLSKLVLPKLP